MDGWCDDGWQWGSLGLLELVLQNDVAVVQLQALEAVQMSIQPRIEDGDSVSCRRKRLEVIQ